VATAEGLTITWKHEEFPPIAEGGVIPHLAVVQRQHFESWRCEVELAKRAAHQLDFPQPWHWPEWLKANWISMDADGTWSGWESRPFLALDNRWHGAEGGRKPLVDTRFVLPPCADWRESLWKNPNATT
jgi:hypothetical protein